jgi:hypothetical protein
MWLAQSFHAWRSHCIVYNGKGNSWAQMEEETKKVMPPSEMEKIRERETHETIARAQRAMLEEKDEVKMMNQMIHYAQCMAARDQQVPAWQQQAAKLQEQQGQQLC